MNHQPNATSINSRLIIESVIVFLLLSFAAYSINMQLSGWMRYVLYVPVLFMQGLWLDRFYIVGHEAAHKKLFPGNLKKNDFWGSVILLPLMVPMPIYRKIHQFHHGFNRHDDHTSVLDTFVTKRRPGKLLKMYYYSLWFIAVFMGGFFIHSLISVLLFLFVPVSLSIKISPAFTGWRWSDQVKSILGFGLGVGLHLGVYFLAGADAYLYVLGFPLLAFAWIWSMLVYIFHYKTTVGEETRYNVRSLNRNVFFSWVLMNFNEHATHHQYPNIPWYELSEKKKPLPEQYRHNQNVSTIGEAILQQLKGPRIVYADKNKKS
jgi:fatty acid desaturase